MIKYSTLFILSCIILCSCSWERTNEAEKMMEEVKDTYSEILSKMPKPGEEAEINPEGVLKDVGFLGDRDAYRIPVAEEQELIDIVNGTYDYETLNAEDKLWLSSGSHFCFDKHPYASKKNYRPIDHEADVSYIKGAKNIGVYRTVERVDGKYHDKIVDVPSTYSGWFFLIDTKKKEIVGATKIEEENDDEFWAYDGENALSENLRDNVWSAANTKINEWGGTDNWWYFGFFHPEEESAN
ncbi:MAG: hypothetical protein MI810_02025 [Flavobacteriales bacterium]|nr:hypothetical protein [Flavobacteriales bacterium]